MDIDEFFSLQKNATNKTNLGYNKQKQFFKKNMFASSFEVNPNRVYKNYHIGKRNPNLIAKTCHYCMRKGHTSNKCFVKLYDIPCGKVVWKPKCLDTNQHGPKGIWVPNPSN